MKSVVATTKGSDRRSTVVATESGYQWTNLLQRDVVHELPARPVPCR